MERIIRIGRNTEGHDEILRAAGYEVTEKDGNYIVTANEVVEGEVDVSTPEKAKALKDEMVANKAVFSYSTRFHLPNGKVLSGIMACRPLGKFSALITKAPRTQTKKASALDEVWG